ncbi:MAG: cell wall metabolism sensor histidine kinase WalK [Deltaproteobacteria bacterium]|nr:cell wall metabolism sensor histidine kinase WalK [Deltaproteobacteria bacterium]
MRRRRLIWQIFPPFLLIILIALVAVTWIFTTTLDDFYREETRHGLEAQGRLVASQVKDILLSGHPDSLDALSKKLGKQSGTRVTIILPDGLVIGDSEEKIRRMDNHRNRPEVRVALSGRVGTATRYSHTLQQEMIYVALPIRDNGQVIACVRTALSLARVDKTLKTVLFQIINSGLLIALIAGLVSLWVSRRISQPLVEMKRGAERFAGGELDRRLPIYHGEELGGLADAMNRMAAQLNDRIRTVVRQRNEQEVVLASMIEGVFAVDNAEKIIRINQAAANLLGSDAETSIGRSIQEVIRKPELQKFIVRALESETSIETDISLHHRGEDRCLQAHGTPLRGADGQKIGALVVVHDVTRLRRLETLRRDFVANVSHELKTPITAIKGSVETLRDGAMEEAESGRYFLEIIARQAERLNAIIEDLLALSRLERDAESAEIVREQKNLLPILESALLTCSSAAQAGNVKLKLFCSEQLSARINAPLFEQAVVNLLDNAIKYSDAEGLVTVEGWQDGGNVMIKVQDRGQGIPAEHLPRLFERFYRVDAARSRSIGGTGLGLAIVKHIVQVHKGEVKVYSTRGSGSVFTLSLPVH